MPPEFGRRDAQKKGAGARGGVNTCLRENDWFSLNLADVFVLRRPAQFKQCVDTWRRQYYDGSRSIMEEGSDRVFDPGNASTGAKTCFFLPPEDIVATHI